MDRRRARRLRPTLDSLEGRIAQSTVPHAPAMAAQVAPQPTRPVLTTSTYDRVMGQVDWAFEDYKGRHQAAGAIANLASDLVSRWISPGAANDPSQATSTDVVADGKGDGVALEQRLNKAVVQLPYGNSQVVPLVVVAWGEGGMTPQNANLYRDRFKTLVRHYLANGLKNGDFAWSGPSRGPAFHAGKPR